MVIAAGDIEERVEILTVYIGIAHALFGSLGNLNGFMAIMEGLEATQVKNNLMWSQWPSLGSFKSGSKEYKSWQSCDHC